MVQRHALAPNGGKLPRQPQKLAHLHADASAAAAASFKSASRNESRNGIQRTSQPESECLNSETRKPHKLQPPPYSLVP
jgi:hypothetical protein